MTGYQQDPYSPEDHTPTVVAGVDHPVIASLSYESLLGPALDQHQTKACVGYAAHAVLTFLTGGAPGTTPEMIYKQCKVIDGRPDLQTTYLRSAADVLRNLYGAGECFRLTTVEQIRASLVSRELVMLGIPVDFSSLLAMVPQSCVLENRDGCDGSHAVCLVGYDDARSAFRARNSYGPEWADSGHFWVPYSYLGSESFDAWGVSAR